MRHGTVKVLRFELPERIGPPAPLEPGHRPDIRAFRKPEFPETEDLGYGWRAGYQREPGGGVRLIVTDHGEVQPDFCMPVQAGWGMTLAEHVGAILEGMRGAIASRAGCCRGGP